jgi:AmmeMemoRadiSam system protein B
VAILLTLLDGSRSVESVHREWCRRLGQTVDFDVVSETLETLDQAFLLDNARSRAARASRLASFRRQPHRLPALANHSYPGNPRDLDSLLLGYPNGDHAAGDQHWHGRGIISPHIDYQRGGPVYARVWRRAAAAVLAADLVPILGTDHNGGPGTITLTRQAYATPYGVLPVAPNLINTLAEAIGEEAAFADELHHLEEHSVELSAVWLHHICHRAGKKPPPVVPILVGSFQHFLSNGAHPATDGRLSAFLDALHQGTRGLRVLVVASVDLAHVGPQFGDDFLMDAERRKALQAADDRLMAAAALGDATAWYERIAAVNDRNRICGFAPTYLMLRYLGPTSGQQVAYAQCTADAQDGSVVSICGLLLD